MYRDKRSHRWNGRQKTANLKGGQPPPSTAKHPYSGSSDSSSQFSRRESASVYPPQGVKMLNTRVRVIYRVSKCTSTTENQKFGLDRHVQRLGFTPAIVDITATSWRKPIPEMQQLLKDIKNGKLDEIHLWRTDRTGRNHEYDVTLWNLCVEHDVLLWYIDDNLRSDRPKDRTTFYKRSVDAEEERQRTSERTKLAFMRKRMEWVRRKHPTRYDEFMSLWEGDEKNDTQTARKMFDELRLKDRDKGDKDVRPCGGGKRKGNRQGKVAGLLDTILACRAAGHSCRKISKDLKLNRATVRSVLAKGK